MPGEVDKRMKTVQCRYKDHFYQIVQYVLHILHAMQFVYIDLDGWYGNGSQKCQMNGHRCNYLLNNCG